MKHLLLSLCLFLSTYSLLAQQAEAYTCKRPASFAALAKTTIATPEEDDYDIHHLKLDLFIGNQSASFKGVAQLDCRVTATSMPVFAFELHDTIIIDSFKLNGQLLPVQTFTNNAPVISNLVRKVTLPVALPQHSYFTAEIYYHSPDPFFPPASFQSRGLRNGAGPDGRITFTACEPYYAALWWPCKQSLQDKIDSTDIWITVPDSLKAGSQGLLRNVTNIAPSFKRYEWKSTYPIAYYLVSLAVGDYVEQSYYMHFAGSSDSMLIQNYLYHNVAPGFMAEIDSTESMINYFSSILGRYPFWKEKYGHCLAPANLAMENQTMSTMGHPAVAHELAHQWFGNNVTCGTWKDIWLNEGLATYLDLLWSEHIGGIVPWNNYMSGLASNDTLYITDTAYQHLPAIAYNKGAAVMRMLRNLAPHDSNFFKSLETYQSLFSGSTATTSDFQNVFESQYGFGLDTFFNQWVYLKGYPIFKVHYAQSATQTFIRLVQTSSLPAVVPYFYTTPVELLLRSQQGDTLVRISHVSNNDVFVFNWLNTLVHPASTPVVIDPFNNIYLKRLAAVKDTSILAVTGVSKQKLLIYPNPSSSNWTIENLSNGQVLRLLTISGRLLWEHVAAAPTVATPQLDLPPGTYLLQVADLTGIVHTEKLLLTQ